MALKNQMSLKNTVNNIYISLSKTLPEYLLSCQKQQPSKEEILLISSKISNKKRIFIEIGSGSGQHIIGQAIKNPDCFFLGFELRYKRAYKTAEKALKYNLANLFIIRCDAHYIEEIFSDYKIDGIFINFPDPWDKMRWKKHRLISPYFLEVYRKLLKNSGTIKLKTDHQGFYIDSVKLIEDHKNYIIKYSSEDLHNSDLIEENIQTEFEQLFLSQNLPIFYLEATLT